MVQAISMDDAYFKYFAERSKEEYLTICKELEGLSDDQVFQLAIKIENQFTKLKIKYGHCRHHITRILKVKREIIWEYSCIRRQQEENRK